MPDEASICAKLRQAQPPVPPVRMELKESSMYESLSHENET